jgi:hypothetical protein
MTVMALLLTAYQQTLDTFNVLFCDIACSNLFTVIVL